MSSENSSSEKYSENSERNKSSIHDTDVKWGRDHALAVGKVLKISRDRDADMVRRFQEEFHLDIFDEPAFELLGSHLLDEDHNDTMIDHIVNPNKKIPLEPFFDQRTVAEFLKSEGSNHLEFDLHDWENRLVGNVLMSVQDYIQESMMSRLSRNEAFQVIRVLIDKIVFGLDYVQDRRGEFMVKNYEVSIKDYQGLEVKTHSWLEFFGNLDKLLDVYLIKLSQDDQLRGVFEPGSDK